MSAGSGELRIEAIRRARFGASADSVIRSLVTYLDQRALTTDPQQLERDLRTRQDQSPTGMKGAIAIPHCRSEAMKEPVLVIAHLDEPADFDGPDGNADVVFLIALPADGDKTHMKVLSRLARAVTRTNVVDAIRTAPSEEDMIKLLGEALTKKAAPKVKPQETKSEASPNTINIIAVTACPTGVAHTYMAADSLTGTAESMENVELAVETQGVARNTTLSAQQIERADVVVFASAIGIKNSERFDALPLVEVPIHHAVNKPLEVLEKARAVAQGHKAPRAKATVLERTAAGILAGVSALIGILMVAGLLLALALGGGGARVSYMLAQLTAITDGDAQRSVVLQHIIAGATFEPNLWMYLYVFAIGLGAVALVVFSSAIARSIGGQVAVTVGAVAGTLAVGLGTGWVGALVAGVAAGWAMRGHAKATPPKALSPVLSVLVLPLIMLGVSAAIAAVSPLLQFVYNGLLLALDSAPTILLICVAALGGVAMNIDLGGKWNKLAYAFAVIGLTTFTNASFVLMAAIIVAGMTAPLGLAAAAAIAPKKFTLDERLIARASRVKGLSFITESALPFLQAKPTTMRLGVMAGGGASAALSVAMQAGSFVPHGGIVALVAMQNPWGWLLSLATGVTITSALILATKN